METDVVMSWPKRIKDNPVVWPSGLLFGYWLATGTVRIDRLLVHMEDLRWREAIEEGTASRGVGPDVLGVDEILPAPCQAAAPPG